MVKFYKREVTSLKFTLFFVLVCSLINYADLRQTTRDQCKTPDNKPGLCMRVRDCKPILNIIQNSPKPMPVAIKNKLKEYRCAYGANVPTVCCSQHPIDMQEATSPPPRLDVIGHKNFNLLPEQCGSVLVTNRIARGTETYLLEYPWTVLLLYKTGRKQKFHCIGTIISERYILTAAHCLVGAPTLIGVRIGEYDLSSEDDCDYHRCLPSVQNLVVEKVIPHPEFNVKGLYENDIGLIRVPKINLDRESADAICLPVTAEIGRQNFRHGTVTGWSFNDPNGKTATGKLQATGLPMQNLTSCTNAYAGVLGITLSQKQLCVGGTTEGRERISCIGDSGGALQKEYYFNEDVRYFQHGVMSVGGRYCRENGSLNIYTKIIYYMKWILDNMEP